jgi:TRAP-type C4-dicarboxylate transport system substrate-binding protein
MQQSLVGGAREMGHRNSGQYHQSSLWDTPFLFNTSKEADAILDSQLAKES